MRKLPQEYENILDNYIINVADYSSPFFYNYGFIPNTVTTLSSISCIICILLLFKAQYYLASLFLIISYFFDCLDGHLARKYEMVTIFGDLYDHISDFLKIFFVLLSMYIINPTKFFIVIPYIIIILILMTIHIGCQEIYYNSYESSSLNFTQKLCPVSNESNVESALKITRFFGCGSAYLVIIISIIYYNF